MANINGTAGNDTITPSTISPGVTGVVETNLSGDDAIFGLDGNDILSGGLGLDTISGGAGADSINGGAGNDVLLGDDGNDTLNGAADSDTALGGAGDDLIRVNQAGEVADGGDGFDTLDLATAGLLDLAGITTTSIERAQLATGATVLTAAQLASITEFSAGGAAFTLRGSAAGVYDLDGRVLGAGFGGFTGSSGIDTVNGSGVADVLGGGAGNDLVAGGAGDDTITGGGGNDRLVGGAGSDSIAGNDGLDTAVFIGKAKNFIVTVQGSITLVEDKRTGEVDTVSGVETIQFSSRLLVEGTNDPEVVTGTPESDSIRAGEGDDTVFGGLGNDLIFGFGGNDEIFAGEGNDSIEGGGGKDTIEGEGGRDTIDGGRNDDLLVGGTGIDTFVFRLDTEDDRVRDFNPENETLVFIGFGETFDEAAEVLAAAVEQGEDVLITLTDGGTVTIDRVGLAELSSTNFAFAL